MRVQPLRWTALAVLPVAIVGCGGIEAPPCNDAGVTSQVLQMVTRAHNDHLAGYRKFEDLAEVKLEMPRVVAYDEKLKIRKCAAEFVVSVPFATSAAMTRYIEVVKRQEDDPTADLRALFQALAGKPAAPEFSVADRSLVAQWVNYSKSQTADQPVRKSIEYQVQKEEGTKDWITSTNVNVTGSIQYVRLADRARKLFPDEVASAGGSQRMAASTSQPPSAAPVAQAAPQVEAKAEPVPPPAQAPAPQPPSPTPPIAVTPQSAPPAVQPVEQPAGAPQAATPVASSTAEIKPSFDCAKASTVIEHLICKDAGLAKLDVELGAAYRSAVQATPDKGSLRAEQNEWLKSKRNKCNTPECLRDTYTARIADLKQ